MSSRHQRDSDQSNDALSLQWYMENIHSNFKIRVKKINDFMFKITLLRHPSSPAKFYEKIGVLLALPIYLYE